MKRGWKIFWVSCAVVAGIGIVCTVAGTLMGATVSSFKERFPYGIGIGKNWHHSYSGYSNGEAARDADISESFKDIREIKAEVNAVSLQILESDSGDVKLETENVDSRLKFNYYVDGDELVLKTKDHHWGTSNISSGTIWLYIPKAGISEAELEVGAGDLYVQNIKADSLSVKVGAGQADIDNFDVNELDLDCGVGELDAYGSFAQEADIDCGIGSVTFATAGKEADYNYKVRCGIGDVQIGNSGYSGLGSQKHIDNRASREMDIDCGIGNVNVSFENE